MERRNTIQKDLVLKTIFELKQHLTADEIYEYIRQEYPTIGKGTVYRNLGILTEEGSIRRVEVPNGPDRFDFTLTEHYHVGCIKCGKVFDADMDDIPDLTKKIRDTHGMQFLNYDIFFKGICPDCQKVQKEVD